VAGSLALLPAAVLSAGWWRVAFLLALPLGLVGLYMRRRVPDTPHFVQMLEDQGSGGVGLADLWSSNGPALRTGFMVIAAGSLTFNTFFVYLPNHLVVTTNRSLSTALFAAIAGLVAAATAALALGRLSDRLGRRPVVRGSLIALVVAAVPLFAVATSGSVVGLICANMLAGVLVGGTLSVSMLAEMFPTEVRASGLSMTAGLAAALVGGTAPFVDQLLFAATGRETAPALYLVVMAGAALVTLSGRAETAFDPLP
jgi:MHS family proline/betaine transporter-like MFS transporter